jgi:hypothetical protein
MTPHRAPGGRPGREGVSQVSASYWERHPDRPFATLIAVAATYCTPEAYDDLISRAGHPIPTTRKFGIR